MVKPIFSRKIKCLKCGKNYKGKLERGNRKYICSTYDLGKGCERQVFSEQFLLDLIENRYNRNLTPNEFQTLVSKIEIQDEFHFTIHLTDQEPIIFNGGHIKF